MKKVALPGQTCQSFIQVLSDSLEDEPLAFFVSEVIARAIWKVLGLAVVDGPKGPDGAISRGMRFEVGTVG